MTLPRYAELYDALYSAKDYENEVRLALELLGPDIASLLDVGCGTGRHARGFAARGVHVVGVDVDPAMIEVARKNITHVSVEPTFLHGNLSRAPHGPFDGAVSLFNVVNYVTERRVLNELFQQVAVRLSKGRRFVFDAWNGIAAILDPPVVKRARAVWRGQDVQLTTTPSVDLWNQLVRLDVAIELGESKFSAENVVHHVCYHRLWTPRDLRDALEAAGFGVPHTGTWSAPRTVATPSDWKLLFAAVRE